MARTRTQRAMHACGHILSGLPGGTPVDPRSLVAATGLVVHVPLVVRRLADAHWIVPDGRGGWVRGGRPAPRPIGHHARGA